MPSGRLRANDTALENACVAAFSSINSPRRTASSNSECTALASNQRKRAAVSSARAKSALSVSTKLRTVCGEVGSALPCDRLGGTRQDGRTSQAGPGVHGAFIKERLSRTPHLTLQQIGVGLTEHHVVLGRVEAAVTRIDVALDHAQRRGDLAFFKTRYKH